MKICPILKAGTMIKSISVEKQVRPNVVSTHSDEVHHESAECIGDECEWYGAGCPAHFKYTTDIVGSSEDAVFSTKGK